MMHILLVDDDKYFRRSLQIQLELQGYKITELEDAILAMQFLDEVKENPEGYPDVVITDMRMPEITGEEFIRSLEQDYPDLPIIVISAYDQPQPPARYTYLKKPFRIHELSEILKQLNVDADGIPDN